MPAATGTKPQNITSASGRNHHNDRKITIEKVSKLRCLRLNSFHLDCAQLSKKIQLDFDGIFLEDSFPASGHFAFQNDDAIHGVSKRKKLFKCPGFAEIGSISIRNCVLIKNREQQRRWNFW